MFGHKAVKVYAAIVVICIVIGSALHVDLVWNLSDLFNGLMVFPNLIALLALSGLVAKAAHDKVHYEVSYDLSRNYTVLCRNRLYTVLFDRKCTAILRCIFCRHRKTLVFAFLSTV